MQDINKRQRERESEQSQTQGICFEVRAHLLYIPAFDTRRISTMLDPNGSPGAATPTALGLPSPYTPQAHRLAEAAPQTRVRTRTRNTESTLGPETVQTHTSASSKEQMKNFGDHNS